MVRVQRQRSLQDLGRGIGEPRMQSVPPVGNKKSSGRRATSTGRPPESAGVQCERYDTRARRERLTYRRPQSNPPSRPRCRHRCHRSAAAARAGAAAAPAGRAARRRRRRAARAGRPAASAHAARARRSAAAARSRERRLGGVLRPVPDRGRIRRVGARFLGLLRRRLAGQAAQELRQVVHLGVGQAQRTESAATCVPANVPSAPPPWL